MLINLTKDIGGIIKDTRKKHAWNQTELAQKIGVTQRTISVMENDPSKTNLETIIQVCAVLSLKISINAIEQTDLDTKPNDELDW